MFKGRRTPLRFPIAMPLRRWCGTRFGVSSSRRCGIAARQCSMQFQPGERDGRCQFSGQCHCGGGDRRNSHVSSQCRSITLVPGTRVRRFDSVAPGMAAEAEDSHDCCLIWFPRGRRVKLYGFGRRFGRNCHRRARKITGGQGKLNTPPGTYSIPVSVSSNGVVHKVTLTLTVD